jgi:hypothetical protein
VILPSYLTAEKKKVDKDLEAEKLLSFDDLESLTKLDPTVATETRRCIKHVNSVACPFACTTPAQTSDHI